MEEYPKNMIAFEKTFEGEEQCLDYVLKVRWPEGARCRHCAGRTLWRAGAILVCKQCGRQTRIMAGTLFEGTHLPLQTWFRAIWWMVTQKNGLSALALKRELGVSYKTAWAMLHKIRSVMVRPERARLAGCVEVDEVFIGGLEEGMRGRQPGAKQLVAIAAQERGRGIGRVRMRVLEDASAPRLLSFIKDNIEPASTVHTDAWKGYLPLKRHGYAHKVSVVKTQGPQALPRVHLAASLLKRWLLGTHQGAVSAAHLNAYLDEFVFRFNRRTSCSRGLLFFRVMQEAVRHVPVPFAKITKHTRPFIPGNAHSK